MGEPPLIEATTLGDLLLRAASRWPAAPAIVFPGVRLDYAEFAARAGAAARGLMALGVEPGDHVGILAPNLPEIPELIFGIALAGAVAVPLNARYKPVELAYVVGNADLRLLLTTTRIADYVDFHALLCDALPGLREAADPSALALGNAPLLRSVIMLEEVALAGTLPLSALSGAAGSIDAAALERRRSRIALRDACIMMYTSGTTANPKGCPLTHESLVRNALGMNRRLGFRQDDLIWDPLPLFHMASIMPLVAIMWSGGGYATDTHFDADAAMRFIRELQPTMLYPSFPAITSKLFNHPDFDAAEWPRVRLVNNVAPPDQLRINMRLVPQAKHVAAYGMTEASGISCHTDPADDDETRATTCGQPYEGVQLRVVDPESGRALGPGERGEMTIRGFSLFAGYYKSPEKNAEVFDSDGWFHTGDICSMDPAGRVLYHGRLKDMLKVGGENVAAIEIESYLSTHPAVQLVQVVGVPHPELQEVAAAYVELKAGATCTAEEIVDFCKGRIASFKVPRHVRFVTQWPMSATKIQKYRLREMFLAEDA